MKVDQNYALSEIIQRQDTKNKTQNEEFSSMLDKKVSSEITSNATNKTNVVSDAEVESFLTQLTSMGASAFWLNFNLEKIQDKIDKKREELMDKLGINDDNKKISDEDMKSALEEVEKMLEDYIKELLKQMEAKSDLEKIAKDSPLNQILSGKNPLSI